MKRVISLLIIISFIASLVIVPQDSHAQEHLSLPVPGSMIDLSPAYVPVLIKGLKVHPENPLLFDFILDTGKSSLKVNGSEFRSESERLIKYFLASLTIKEDDLWVNLSPYEKDRMITRELGQTELGRDMLAEDYILKQLTASLIYPEKQLGKEFWGRVYAKAQKMYGSSEVPIHTFNKVWIVADKAKVLERNNAAYVIGAHLKVMLEEDYLSLSRHSQTHSIASQIVKEIILPELEKEVNQGQNFANLRQMFYSMILATWYKETLKTALLNQVYSNKNKIGNLSYQTKQSMSSPNVFVGDPQYIYQQYLKAYKKGVFNYIKDSETPNGVSDVTLGRSVPRKYFSGGIAPNLGIKLDRAQIATSQEIESMGPNGDMAMESVNMAKAQGGDKAMMISWQTELQWHDYIRASVRKNGTVLLIEDDASFRSGMVEFLKEFKLNVLVAGNYVDGMRLFELNKHKVGLVITDDVMPRDENNDMPEFLGDAIRGEVLRIGDGKTPVIWQSSQFIANTFDEKGLIWPKKDVGDNLEKLLDKAMSVEPVIIRSGASAQDVFNKNFPEYQSNPILNPALWGDRKNPLVMRYDLRSYTGFDDRISDFSNRPNEFIAEQIMALAQAKGEAFFSKDFLFDLRLLRKPTALEVLTAFAEHMAKDKETMRFYVRAVADTYINIMNKDTNRPKEVEMAKQYIATIKVMWERWLLQGAKPIVLNIVSDSKMETVVRDMQLISAATGLRDQGIKDQVSEFLSQNPDELVGKIAKEVGSASRAVASFYAMRRIKSQELLYHLEQGRKFAPNFFSVSKGIKIKFSDGLIINFSKPHTDYVTVSITANLNAGQKKELFSQIAKAIGVKSPDAAMLSPYQGSDSFGASEAFKIYAHLIDTKTGDSFVSSDLDVIIKKGPLRTRAVGILSKVGLVVKKSEGVWGLMRVDKNSAYELLVGKDKAMASLVRGQVDFKKAPGGIDLNAKHMGLDIVKETEGVTARFNPDIVAEFRRGDFLGIVPVIIRITPISNLLPLLGIEANPN